MAQPEKVFKQGGCVASVFVNDVVREGQTRHMRSVAFHKRYMDRNGDWQSTSHLNVNDLPKAALVLNNAYEYITSGVASGRDNGEEEDQGEEEEAASQ